MMKLTKDEMIAALRLRYDHYSAQTIFELARDRAGLPDEGAYAAPQVQAFRAALGRVGDRVERVYERLDSLLAGGGADAAAPEPAPVAPAAPVAKEPAPAPAAKEPAPAAKDAVPAPAAKDASKPTGKDAAPAGKDAPAAPAKPVGHG